MVKKINLKLKQSVAQSSSTSIKRPVIIPKKIQYQPKEGETMLYRTSKDGARRFVGIAKSKQAAVSSDNRSWYQKKKDQEYAQAKRKVIQDQKTQEEGLKNMGAFFKLISPSTYIGAAGNAATGNGTFMQNMLAGTGSGNEAVDLVTDVLTPGMFSKAFKYGTSGTQFLKNLAAKPISKAQKVIRKVEKNITVGKRIKSLNERLYQQVNDYNAKKLAYMKKFYKQENASQKESLSNTNTQIFNGPPPDSSTIRDTRKINVDWDKIDTQNANKYSKKHKLGITYEEQPFEKTVNYPDHTERQIVKRPAVKINYQPGVNTGQYKVYRFRNGVPVEGNTKLDVAASTYVAPKSNPAVDYRYIGNTTGDGRIVSGVEPLKEVLNDNIKYLQETIPGFKPFGSSVGVVNGAIVHNTHDIDGYITRKILKQLQDEGRVIEKNQGNTYLYKVGGGKYGEAGNVDLNVIAVDQNGKLLNNRSLEMYKQFFPYEYQKQSVEVANGIRPYIQALDKSGNILTEEQLLDSYDPLTKTILDSGEIDFDMPSKSKHAGRYLEYLAGDNPEAVHKALQYEAARAGENGYLFPKLNFGTPEENAQLLQAIGFKGDVATIAKDSAKMQNVLDYWLLSARRNYRAFGAGDISGSNKSVANTWRNATDWNASLQGSGGHAKGGGLNSTIDGPSGHGQRGGLFSYTQPKIDGLQQMTDPVQAVNAVNMANGIGNPIEVRNGILNMFGIDSAKINPKINLLDVLPSSGEWAKQMYEQAAQKYGISALAGGPYGKGTYSGIIRKLDPKTDAVGIQLYDGNDLLPGWSTRMKKVQTNGLVNNYTQYGNPEDYRPEQNMQSWFTDLFFKRKNHYYNLENNTRAKLNKVRGISSKYLNRVHNIKESGAITGLGGIPIGLFGYQYYDSMKEKEQRDYYNNLIKDYERFLYNTLETQRDKLGEYGIHFTIPGNDYQNTFINRHDIYDIEDGGQEAADSIMQQIMKPIK